MASNKGKSKKSRSPCRSWACCFALLLAAPAYYLFFLSWVNHVVSSAPGHTPSFFEVFDVFGWLHSGAGGSFAASASQSAGVPTVAASAQSAAALGAAAPAFLAPPAPATPSASAAQSYGGPGAVRTRSAAEAGAAAGTAAEAQAVTEATRGGDSGDGSLAAAAAAAVASPPAKWYFCSNQWDHCVCAGTVRWGGKNKWFEIPLADGALDQKVDCSIRKLKDVLPGEDKSCECSAPSKIRALAEEDLVESMDVVAREKQKLPFWLFCAQQWQECICEGKVRWGNKNKWQIFEPKEGESEVTVKCSISELPDVAPGDDGKHCECWVSPEADFSKSINPGFKVISGSGSADAPENMVTSCEIFKADYRKGSEAAAQQWVAVEPFCDESWTPPASAKAGPKALRPEMLRRLMKSWVVPAFRENYDKYFGESGWLDRAFVNYYAGLPSGKHAGMTRELVESVHMFSAAVVVVFFFGMVTPTDWSPGRYPRLVLIQAAPLPPGSGRSFNFNKLRSMLLSRVRVGVQLDSDQFVAPGVDRLFERTAEEVTKEYPMPILPAHFLDWGPHGQGPGGAGAKLWHRYCPAMQEGKCKFQTQRWGHAHPTWSFWAVPFLGRWLRRNFRDEWLPEEGGKQKLRVIDVTEDEDLLNVGTWEEGGIKQWCKFDIPDPTEFEVIMGKRGHDAQGETCLTGHCGDITRDDRYHKKGIAKAFYTAHHAVEPKETKKYLARLKDVGNRLAPPILYHNHFYKSGVELRKAYPNITCLI